MDEAFAIFLNEFGPPIEPRQVPPALLAQYEGQLPSLLLRYWKEQGFSGYADGLLWTVDPGLYTTILNAALEGTPFATNDTYHVIARTAFGQLFAWGKRTGPSLRIDPSHGLIFPSSTTVAKSGGEEIAVQSFFMSLLKRLVDFSDEANRPLFARARKKLGRVADDEIYAFEPALALGGAPSLANLQKLTMLPHLEVLLALGPLRIVSPPSSGR